MSEDLVTTAFIRYLSIVEATHVVKCYFSIRVEYKYRHESANGEILNYEVKRLSPFTFCVHFLCVKREHRILLSLTNLERMKWLVLLGNYEICDSLNKLIYPRIFGCKVLVVLFQVVNVKNDILWKLL